MRKTLNNDIDNKSTWNGMILSRLTKSILRQLIPRDIRVRLRDQLGIPRWLHDDYSSLRVISPGLSEHLVLDVGACEGWFTQCWLHYNPKARIVCFEPSRETFSKRLVPVLGGDTRVTLENVGLGDTDETREFHNFAFYKSSSFLTPNEAFHLKPAESAPIEQVPIIRLDNYLNAHGLNHVTLAKIDVQGFESKVLGGLGDRIGDVDWLYIEGSIHPLYNTESTFCRVFQMLKDADFFLTNFAASSFGTGVLRECNMLFANRRVISEKALKP